jgi:putative methyltransferase (TIGR04325 family)
VSGTRPLAIAHEATAMTGLELWAHNMVLVYGYVLARASRQRGDISVLDWGGGIGHYAIISRRLMPELTIRYTVKDLPALCRAGRENLPEVTFVSEDDGCLGERYDLVFASGSLQYENDWRRLLSRLAASSRSWLYVARLPVVVRAETFAVIQRPQAYGYRGKFVSWVFNRQEFLDHAIAVGLSLEREFLLCERAHVVGAPEQFDSRGFLFRTTGT